MRVNTYSVEFTFGNGEKRSFSGLSLVALQRYIWWHQENFYVVCSHTAQVKVKA